MSETLYIQINQNVEMCKREVTLGDVATMWCTDGAIVARVKTIKLVNIPDVKKRRISFSILYVIKLINEIYPDVEVNNVGESDFIVDYVCENHKKGKYMLQWIEIGIVTIITFVGSIYGIMAYNNDVSTNEIFEKVYELFGTSNLADYKLIEVAYAIGLAAGIIIFYNHLTAKKFSGDPTPLQVEMDKYEKDVDTSMIDRSAKDKKERTVS